jgi:DNA primase
MIDLESILGSLDKVRKQGQGYIACCPVHGDNNPSMSIKQADDKILMYCHACGARGPEIVQARRIKAQTYCLISPLRLNMTVTGC